jgi:hypothetical protein
VQEPVPPPAALDARAYDGVERLGQAGSAAIVEGLGQGAPPLRTVQRWLQKHVSVSPPVSREPISTGITGARARGDGRGFLVSRLSAQDCTAWWSMTWPESTSASEAVSFFFRIDPGR